MRRIDPRAPRARASLLAAGLALQGLLAACGGGGGSGPASDTTRPAVISTSPSVGQGGVSRLASVVITFSEPMDPSSLGAATVVVSRAGELAPTAGAVAAAGAVATFTPSAPLAYGAAYDVAVGTGARDLAGNTLAAPYRFSFTTEPNPDVTPPSVVSLGPPDGTAGVPLRPAVSVTLSEPVDPASVDTSRLTLEVVDGAAVAGAVAVDGALIAFTPAADLPFGAALRATLHAGVRDLAGNALAVDTTWSFTVDPGVAVAVTLAGAGAGTVTSAPAGIDCGGVGPCAATFASGAAVTLQATPAAGSEHDGFMGACATVGAACRLAPAGAAAVTAIFGPVVPSAAGHVLALDGGADAAVHELTPDPVASPLDGSPTTVEAWVFPLGGDIQVVAADSGYFLAIMPAPLRLELLVLPVGSGFPAWTSFSGSAHPLELGRWNHVAGMIDGRTIRVAVNGELSPPTTLGADLDFSAPQAFSVGAAYPAVLWPHPFVGFVDEVRLSAAVRYADAFTPAPRLDADGVTLGLWRFDEPAGATVFADASGNGRALTGFGGAATAARSRPAPAPAPGDLLLGFGAGGVWTVDPSSSDDQPWDALVAAGALYVAGDDQAGGVGIRVEKLDLATAARFPAFGASGVVRSDPSAGYDGAWAVATDGVAFYLAGYDMTPGLFDYTWRVEKRDLLGGALVAGFGAGGVVGYAGLGTDHAVDVLVTGGSLYVIGYEQDAGGPRGRIEKRSAASGDLATGFGAGGAVTGPVGPKPSGAATDGSSLWIASTLAGTGTLQLERRSLDTGELVPAFGAGGVVTEPAPLGDLPIRIAVDGQALYVATSGGGTWLVEKRDAATGALDAAFGVGGQLVGAGVIGALLVDGGHLYLAGSAFDPVVPPGVRWWVAERSPATGALVPGFGAGGVATGDLLPSGSEPTALATDGASLYLVGFDRVPGSLRWRVERLAR